MVVSTNLAITCPILIIPNIPFCAYTSHWCIWTLWVLWISYLVCYYELHNTKNYFVTCLSYPSAQQNLHMSSSQRGHLNLELLHTFCFCLAFIFFCSSVGFAFIFLRPLVGTSFLLLTCVDVLNESGHHFTFVLVRNSIRETVQTKEACTTLAWNPILWTHPFWTRLVQVVPFCTVPFCTECVVQECNAKIYLEFEAAVLLQILSILFWSYLCTCQPTIDNKYCVHNSLLQPKLDAKIVSVCPHTSCPIRTFTVITVNGCIVLRIIQLGKWRRKHLSTFMTSLASKTPAILLIQHQSEIKNASTSTSELSLNNQAFNNCNGSGRHTSALFPQYTSNPSNTAVTAEQMAKTFKPCLISFFGRYWTKSTARPLYLIMLSSMVTRSPAFHYFRRPFIISSSMWHTLNRT